MKNLILIFLAVFVTASNSQDKKVELKNTNKFNTGIGVVDMKKILGQSTAYQSIVNFSSLKRCLIRRKHRNTLLNKRMLLEIKKVIF